MLAPALAHDVGISVTARLAIMKHAQSVANLMSQGVGSTEAWSTV